MEKYSQKIQIRWSDIDQNRHLRHSVYYDYGAMIRINFLNERGLTSQKMEELKTGPIMFREEAVFKREISLNDKVVIDVQLTRSTDNYSRWSLRHHFIKDDGTVAAILNLDGAWIDLEKRKLGIPGSLIKEVFDDFPKSEDYQLILKTEKV